MGGSRTLAHGRWIQPYHWTIAITSQVFTAGRVLLAMFQVARPVTVDGISYVVGAAANGNVTVGVVGPLAAATDTALGAPVIAESASTAQGAINSAQFVPFAAAVRLGAGVYYAALEGSDATGTYMRLGNQAQAGGLLQYYDRVGGYGALTATTPAVTDTGNAGPGLLVRTVT